MNNFNFEPEFEFVKGEIVKININKQTGIVVARKCEYVDQEDGTFRVTMNYLVKANSHRKDWYKENELKRVDEVSPIMDKEINSLMVDGNLILGNYDMVKYWSKKE